MRRGAPWARTFTDARTRLVHPTLPDGKPNLAIEQGYNYEAREFLRSKLIGKQVQVCMDYVKAGEQGYAEKRCASVTLPGG